MYRSLVGLLVVLVSAAPAYGGDPTSDESARLLLKALPPDTFSQQEVCTAGGITLETAEVKELLPNLKPTGASFAVVSIKAPGKPLIMFERDRRAKNSIGVVIAETNSGEPMLSVGDNDGDGRLDSLSYTTLDASGNPQVEIIDYEMDGQPDFKLHYTTPSYIELWHGDRWLKVEKRGEERGVWSNGVFLPVRTDSRGRLVTQ